jgi:hypothetical protein
MFRFVAVFLAAVSAGACSIDLQGQGTVVREERRFKVSSPAEVVLKTFDGAIDLRSWDRDEVLVEIERRANSPAEANALEVSTATQDGGRLTIEARNPNGGRGDGVVHIGSWQSPSVSFVVTMPRRASVQADTGDGAIAVRDLTGTAALHTADGAIRAERVEGDVRVETGDGSVSIRDLQGELDLNTGDGAVDVSGRLDALRLNTGDGSIQLDVHDGSMMKGEWSVHTGDGAISIRLPATFNANLDAHSGDGRIAVSGIGTSTQSRDDDRPAQVRAPLGRGGPMLRVQTGDGPITITR